MIQNFHLYQPRTDIPVAQVQFIPNFLHDHEISAIEQLSERYPYQHAIVQGNVSHQNLNLRQSKIKWIQWDDSNWWVYTKIMEKANELNHGIWQFDLFGINEFLQYTEYDGGSSTRGHYDWHIDIGSEGLSSNRKLTFECILHDNYSGGEFSVLMGPSENKVKLSKGDAVIYPSFLLNKTYPIISGKRSSIVSWISGPTFK